MSAFDPKAILNKLASGELKRIDPTAPSKPIDANWGISSPTPTAQTFNNPAPTPAPAPVNTPAKNAITGMTWQDSLGYFGTPEGAGALEAEKARVKALIDSGNAPNMEVARSWYDQINAIPTYKPPAPTPAPIQPIQFSPPKTDPIPNIMPWAYATNPMTVEDFAKKYGFDYSKKYATDQASVEAEAMRNAFNQSILQNQHANKRNLASIEQGVWGALDGLDGQRFLAQQNLNQDQSLRGLNAGIAGDQNTRLAMNTQNVMGDIYGQANLGRMDENQRFSQEAQRLQEALGLVDREELAMAERLYNERLQQGFANTMALNQLKQTDNLAVLQAELQQRGQNIGMSQFDRSFDWGTMMDTIGLTGTLPDFMGGGLSVQEQERRFREAMAKDQVDWGKLMDQAGLTGNLPNSMGGGSTLAKQQLDWARDMDLVNLTGQLPDYLGGGTTLNKQNMDWAKMLDQIEMTGQLPDFLGGGLTVQEQDRQFRNKMAQDAFNRPYEQLTRYEQEQINSLRERNKGSGGGGGGGWSSLSGAQSDILLTYLNSPPEVQEFLRAQFPELKTIPDKGTSGSVFDNYHPFELEKMKRIAETKYKVNFKNTNEQQLKDVVFGMMDEFRWGIDEAQDALDYFKTLIATKPPSTGVSSQAPDSVQHLNTKYGNSMTRWLSRYIWGD